MEEKVMTAKIAILEGDGVGPEVTAEARKVLKAVAERFGRNVAFVEAPIGGAAIDATGEALPAATIEACRACEAILLGAVGGPKWDDPSAKVRPEQGLLGLRKTFGLFANLRPVRAIDELIGCSPLRRRTIEGADLIVVRELTSGLYFGASGREPDPSGEQAFDTMAYTTGEIARIARRAAALADSRRGRLTLVDKANVLETSRLWRTTTSRVVRDEFPDVALEFVLVDAAAMHLIRNPRRFDVIVTENLFGDILSDEASVLAGSMGMLASASLGEGAFGLYEPVHGSAPDIAGRGVANPIGAILSAAMLCRDSLGWAREADAIEAAVDRVVADGFRTADIAGPGEPIVSTSRMGDAIAQRIEVPAEATGRAAAGVAAGGFGARTPQFF
jgi:3-isopropylmalate dehydrogenase